MQQQLGGGDVEHDRRARDEAARWHFSHRQWRGSSIYHRELSNLIAVRPKGQRVKSIPTPRELQSCDKCSSGSGQLNVPSKEVAEKHIEKNCGGCWNESNQHHQGPCHNGRPGCDHTEDYRENQHGCVVAKPEQLETVREKRRQVRYTNDRQGALEGCSMHNTARRHEQRTESEKDSRGAFRHWEHSP